MSEEKKFKVHILKQYDAESFKTYCGINGDTCSESFWDTAGNTTIMHKSATCNRCIELHKKWEKKTMEEIRANR